MTRLIDADALKKALKSNCDLCNDKNTNWCERCCPHNDFEDLIDDAPTAPQDCSDCKRYDFPYFVIKFDKEQMQELVDKAKAEVLASIERPQGDRWGKWVISEIQCPNCLEYFSTDCYSTEELNKCPNCGARMEVQDAKNDN